MISIKKNFNIKIDLASIALIMIQFVFWYFVTSTIKPDLIITENPPSRSQSLIYGLGDEQLSYRMLGQFLQNSGDRFGETIPLQDYDYTKLEKWFFAIGALDPSSDYIASIAGMYFSQSQNTEHCRYVVRYLLHHASMNSSTKWRWYIESVYLAMHKLNDVKLAKSIGDQLLSIDQGIIPPWIKFIIPIMLSNRGDFCIAYDMIKNLSEDDLNAIVNDKVFSVRGNEYNFISQMMMKKLQQIKYNQNMLYKCQKSKPL